jgi:translation initiation factor 1
MHSYGSIAGLETNPQAFAMSIVYSTGIGAICAGCRRPVAQCVCKSAKGKPLRSDDARVVRVSRQTQGRAGKGVTVISGLPLSAMDLETLATELKRRCGSGGTVRDGLIEIQGEHRDRLVEELIKRGYPARRAGG